MTVSGEKKKDLRADKATKRDKKSGVLHTARFSDVPVVVCMCVWENSPVTEKKRSQNNRNRGMTTGKEEDAEKKNE
jgi:hypothetical protein